MGNFIIYSVVASVVLTVVLNVLLLLFPQVANKLQKKFEENARRTIERHEDPNQPRVKVFFPWKIMLAVSIILTILLNLISFLS